MWILMFFNCEADEMISNLRNLIASFRDTCSLYHSLVHRCIRISGEVASIPVLTDTKK